MTDEHLTSFLYWIIGLLAAILGALISVNIYLRKLVEAGGIL